MTSNRNIHAFVVWMKQHNKSQSTVSSYTRTVAAFYSKNETLSKEALDSFREWLLTQYSVNTANTKISALNTYLKSLDEYRWQLPKVKQQTIRFAETVISQNEYNRLKEGLRSERNLKYYFMVCYLGMTGVRVSELLQIRAEDVLLGYIDLIGKGGKNRRVYIPTALRDETLQWLDTQKIQSGLIFLSRTGKPMNRSNVYIMLKRTAVRYGVSPEVVYPHSFRHFFAKNFLNRCNDVALLADVLGHSNIETTRLYLRKSSSEVQSLMNTIVNW